MRGIGLGLGVCQLPPIVVLPPSPLAVLPRFSLVGHRRRGPGDLFRVAEVVMREWLELRIKLVNQGYARGNVQTDDFLIRDVVEVLDQGAKAVAMGGDDDLLALLDRGNDRLVPVREEPRDRVLEAFGQGQLALAQFFVAGVGAG